MFTTLQTADRLLLTLRQRVSAPMVGAPAAPPVAPPGPGTPIVPPGAGPLTVISPASGPSTPPRQGIRGSSIPKILLTLGGLCLFVAALTFLAVAWQLLGIGGRTVVLIGLTVVTGIAGTGFTRRGLRAAGEALTAVCLGFLTLDLFGARSAGWLGELSDSSTLTVCGVFLTLGGVALTVASRAVTPRVLIAPQLAVGAGFFLTAAGLNGSTDGAWGVYAGAVIAGLLLALLAHRVAMPVLAWAGFVPAAFWWLVLLVVGFGRAVGHPTAHDLWLGGHGWALASAAALLAAAAAMPPVPPPVRGIAGSVAAALGTLTLIVPVLDNSPLQAAVACLLTLLGWIVIQLLLPTTWRVIPVVSMLGAGAAVLTFSGELAAQAAWSVASVGPAWTTSAWVRLDPGATATHPLLLVPNLVTLLVGLLVIGRLVPDPWAVLRRLWGPLAAAVALAAVGSIALYPVPLAVILAGLGLVVAGLLGWGWWTRGEVGTATVIAALVLGIATLAAALPSDWLTLWTLLGLSGAATGLVIRGYDATVRVAGQLVAPLSVAALIWTVEELASLPEVYRAAPILLLLGVTAIALPRQPLELSAAAAGAVAAGVSVWSADQFASALAIHLTLAGSLVVASSLVHPSRRMLGWPGGLLLAMASWVRLWDVGVETIEAYTMPSAIAILVAGWCWLRRDPQVSTFSALGAGLSLATVPSLVQVVAVPHELVSIRAALLGVGCLALVLAGTRLRWSAAVVIGGTVGGLLVLRELAPYSALIPTWIMIGLAGGLLTVVGITWEDRMRNLRTAAHYLGRLR